MNRIIIDVPKGIKYLSDWREFNLPEYPCIINKQITGCGFTEWCINNNKNIILCSPRKILLENKEEQHAGQVFYARNDLEHVLNVDKDISSNKPEVKKSLSTDLSKEEKDKIKKALELFKDNIKIYYFNCIQSTKPCKFLVTYDSFRHIKEALGDQIRNFHIVIDEFQSIFTDSRFKSDTELEFLNYLKDLNNISFVSATPMIDEYLEMLDEFKDLPYFELDWKTQDPSRIIKPQLDAIPCQRVLDAAYRFIEPYLSNKFESNYFIDNYGNIQEIESKELVIYVNSVKNICDIIRRCGLTYSNTNVLCSNTPDNQKKIRKAFGLKKNEEGGIGKVPKRNEYHKMFTLCTRTVYLGADFYSTCARTLILSDANVDTLAVDITLDLPQILGRQRLKENPWKNRATLYFRSILSENKKSIEEFKEYIEWKKKRTDELLLSYKSTPTQSAKHTLAETYQKMAKAYNYRDDYIAVNTHSGSDLLPVQNDLVMISEIRAFQIQQLDYKDRFTVLSIIDKEIEVEGNDVNEFIKVFESLSTFPEKMELLCNNQLSSNDILSVLELVPMSYKNYYCILGPEKIKSLHYKKYLIDDYFLKNKSSQDNSEELKNRILTNFKVGNKYLKSNIKSIIADIYTSLGIKDSPKAVVLEKYFELKLVNLIDPISGNRIKGFEIVKIKDIQ